MVAATGRDVRLQRTDRRIWTFRNRLTENTDWSAGQREPKDGSRSNSHDRSPERDPKGWTLMIYPPSISIFAVANIAMNPR